MACLFECSFESVRPGNRMLVEGIGWCIKLHPQEGSPYNAMIETCNGFYDEYYAKNGGKLVIVPPGTTVTSGYGWGHR